MTSEIDDEFSKLVMSHVDATEAFKPHAIYTPDGDCIELLLTNESSYAKRIDARVTIYLSQKDDGLVGCLLKGVKKLIREVVEKYPGFAAELRSGKNIRLDRLFTAQMWVLGSPEDAARLRTYRRLRDVTEEKKIEADIDNLAFA